VIATNVTAVVYYAIASRQPKGISIVSGTPA
jgi:hypothetical protein